MKLRSVLLTAIKNHIARSEMSQAQAANLFGVTQPRISDLMRGKFNLSGSVLPLSVEARFAEF